MWWRGWSMVERACACACGDGICSVASGLLVGCCCFFHVHLLSVVVQSVFEERIRSKTGREGRWVGGGGRTQKLFAGWEGPPSAQRWRWEAKTQAQQAQLNQLTAH